MDEVLGVRFVEDIVVWDVFSSLWSMKRTRLFVVFIALDTGTVEILFSLERPMRGGQILAISISNCCKSWLILK